MNHEQWTGRVLVRALALGGMFALASLTGCSGDDDEGNPAAVDGGREASAARDAQADSRAESSASLDGGVPGDARADRDALAESAVGDAPADRDAIADSTVADTGNDVARDAGAPVLDSGRDAEAGIDATADARDAAPSLDSSLAVVDAQADQSIVPEASVPTDAGGADADAGATDAGSARDAAEATAPVDAGTGSSLPVNATCVACAQATGECPNPTAPCGNLSGAARSDCFAVLDCIRRTNCHSGGGATLDCYCGSADTTQCLATSGAIVANGACKAEIERGLGTTDPVEVQARFDLDAYAAVPAIRLTQCESALCTTECVPYTAGQRDN